MIPALTMGISAISGIASAASRIKTAKEQAKKAEELRRKRVMPEKIQQEYKDVANKAQLMALSNVPGIDTAKANLDASQANTVRTIKESGRTGSDRLSSLAMLEGNKMKTLRDLDVTNAEFKVKRQDIANNKQEQIAREKDARRAEARLEEQKIRQQADALEVSATANRQNAIDDITSTISSTAGSMGMLGGGDMGAKSETPKIETPKIGSVNNINTQAMLSSNINAPNRQDLKATELVPQVNTDIDYKKADVETVKSLQSKLKDAGLYEGKLDGIYGPVSEEAYKKLLERYATNR